MATAQQLLGLIRSHAKGDDDRFIALTVQLAVSEERKGHLKLAVELRRLAEEAQERGPSERTPPASHSRPVPIVAPRGDLAGLMSAAYPKTRLNHMVLDKATERELRRIILEHRQKHKLDEHGLHPRNRILLVGPPGCGKTLTASALAGELGLPLFTVLLHGVITKFMGETAAKLRLVFDAMALTRGVYLFDELDAIGGRRDADNDIGEARRMLNSFLQFMEEDHGESLLIATTNHPELLDKALFRRFHIILTYDVPSLDLLVETIRARLANFDLSAIDWRAVGAAGEGLSHAEIVRAAEDAARNAVLDGLPAPTAEGLVDALTARRAMFSPA
jgi:AAA+ superfamily predicted ATPase